MKSDIPIKRVLQVKPQDWAHFLLPDTPINKISELNTVKVPKSQSLIDGLQMINDEFILHVEANGYKDMAIPARMLRYRSDVWEYTISKGLGTPSIKQVLVLFFESHDNKQHELYDSWDGETTLSFGYRVIKIWEIPKDEVISKELVGLYPLLPLMKRDDGETPDDILKTSVEMAFSIPDDATRDDLLSAMALLAEGKFSRALIEKYIRREMLMRSALFEDYAKEYAKEYAREAEEKGIEKGKLEVAKTLISMDFCNSEVSKITGLDIDIICGLNENG